MKTKFRDSFFVVVMVMLVAGCFTGHQDRSQLRLDYPADLGSLIESAVNDRSTWVDPNGAL